MRRHYLNLRRPVAAAADAYSFFPRPRVGTLYIWKVEAAATVVGLLFLVANWRFRTPITELCMRARARERKVPRPRG